MRFNPKLTFLAIFIGSGMLLGIWQFLPDGRLHIVFCDVGQGDAIYLRMPNQADVLVDGGPDNSVLSCLGKYMPFYDHTLDMVVLTHPQKDHFQGLISVVDRYKVKYFASTNISNDIDEYKELMSKISQKHILIKHLAAGNRIKFGQVTFDVVWPSKLWLDTFNTQAAEPGVTSDQVDLNLFSLYLYIKYQQFDLLLTGDGGADTQSLIDLTTQKPWLPTLEVLKVPHHGSKTGLTDDFVKSIRLKLSIISVGKNHFGHPDEKIMEKLLKYGQVLRTDKKGDIEIVAEDNKWRARK